MDVIDFGVKLFSSTIYRKIDNSVIVMLHWGTFILNEIFWGQGKLLDLRNCVGSIETSLARRFLQGKSWTVTDEKTCGIFHLDYIYFLKSERKLETLIRIKDHLKTRYKEKKCSDLGPKKVHFHRDKARVQLPIWIHSSPPPLLHLSISFP